MTHLSAQEIIDLNKEYTFFSWSNQGQVQPIPMVRAEGVYFWDADGKRYLDFASQLVNTNVGHQHPKVVKAIQEQAGLLTFAAPGMATEPRGLLGKKLAEITPGDLKKTFFTLGGAEANENAIKIARFYTGRQKIIARYRSYHGATHGALALTGDYRRLPAEPAIPGVVRILDPYCYRCPFGQKIETCHRECIQHIEEVIQHEGPDQIAALFLEGITGTNGLIIPPDDYWPRVREICDRYGILLVPARSCRAGAQASGLPSITLGRRPDITRRRDHERVRLGAVIVTEKIARFFDDKVLYAGLTYSGHALACAAALATIEAYEEDHIFENAKEVGKYLGTRLEELKSRYQVVGDVRYKGLFSALELVKDRESKEPLDITPLKNFMIANGVYVFNFKNILFVVPPLVITREQLEEGLTLLDEGLAELMA
jgi:taurine--2-oxoglutarate transaminase